MDAADRVGPKFVVVVQLQGKVVGRAQRPQYVVGGVLAVALGYPLVPLTAGGLAEVTDGRVAPIVQKLVEVAAEAKPPVCRLLDYSKYKYDQEQKAKEANDGDQETA
ncbi:MAG: hypothetical protein IIB66_11560 [Proteobacteria bacterium]|nr:hypothetical protein [Pseudomonadota bacterium]